MSRTLILTRYGKKSCRHAPSTFNNCVKFNNLYLFIRVVFVSNNRVMQNFTSSSSNI